MNRSTYRKLHDKLTSIACDAQEAGLQLQEYYCCAKDKVNSISRLMSMIGADASWIAAQLAEEATGDTREVEISDDTILHEWQCDECEGTVRVGPFWYADNGTPVCCDRDMSYVKTVLLRRGVR